MGIDPGYALDRMETYEITSLFEYRHLRNRDQWEMARLLGYILAQVNSTNKLQPSDILKFPWDGDEVKGNAQASLPPTKEELERLRSISQHFIDNGLLG